MKGPKYYYDSLSEMLIKRYGFRVGTFLTNRFARAIKRTGDCCIDNLRIARTNNLIEMQRYNNIKSNGCCGFYDKEFAFESENEPTIYYIIGFNYKH